MSRHIQIGTPRALLSIYRSSTLLDADAMPDTLKNRSGYCADRGERYLRLGGVTLWLSPESSPGRILSIEMYGG